jgi:hypothetical protein
MGEMDPGTDRAPGPDETGLTWPPTPATVFDGLAGDATSWWPTRSFVIRARTLSELGQVGLRAARLVLAACARRSAVAGELRDALGIPAGRLPFLREDEPLADHLLAAVRPDIITESGVPKIVELNVDGSVGAAPRSDLLASRFLAFYRGTPLAESLGLTVPPSATEARSASIRSCLGLARGAYVVIPAFSVGALPGMEEYQAFAHVQAPVCESLGRLGLDAASFPLERLATDERGLLRADGRPVDGVLRLFDGFNQPGSAGLDALIRAVRARTVRMYTPEATRLLGNKMALAWLWEDIGGLSGPDREFVRRHIPWTAPVQAVPLPEALARQATLVLKPGHGYGGTGVVIGPAVTPEEWRQAVDSAAAQGQHILQEFTDGDRVRLSFTHRETGETRTAGVRFNLGPFIFGGQTAAVLVRHGTPDAGPVLNLARGAFGNTALLARNDVTAADL